MKMRVKRLTVFNTALIFLVNMVLSVMACQILRNTTVNRVNTAEQSSRLDSCGGDV